jgi:hypothetical protein
MAWRPVGVEAVVLMAPVAAFTVIPNGSDPFAAQVNVPLMPLALGLVVCV